MWGCSIRFESPILNVIIGPCGSAALEAPRYIYCGDHELGQSNEEANNRADNIVMYTCVVCMIKALATSVPT